ncbi:hypothetical protein GCM10012275_26120 [Longimycelium tulufanense]|uniref:VOC domain-containing protein n=1 Tax=Longimycelium tulufanense TaxID=907463 RepID=A0A8J3C8D9_9PSEU|nr:VOC family protein [Longimycelium tulufanense]GGM53813.1 hypothetical protein GCM10012275_26120 [Longimycelium tulufanense]
MARNHQPGRIAGVHALVFAEDAEAVRAFFRDVCDLGSVDAGQGWLIFALPPAELAVHPTEGAPRHELYLMCHDIYGTVEVLTGKGVEVVAPISDEGWGLLTRVRVPGGAEFGLYEPRHDSPLPTFRNEEGPAVRRATAAPAAPPTAPGAPRVGVPSPPLPDPR